MRFKAVPPPHTLQTVEDAWRAVPLVPDGENDCCRRIARKLDRHDLDEARSWFAFLRALDLVEPSTRGYARSREFPDEGDLADRFRSRVFGVEELLEHIDEDGRITPAEAFSAIEDAIPPWERHRHPGRWETIWTDRIEALLEWGVIFGLFEITDGQYFISR